LRLKSFAAKILHFQLNETSEMRSDDEDVLDLDVDREEFSDLEDETESQSEKSTEKSTKKTEKSTKKTEKADSRSELKRRKSESKTPPPRKVSFS